MTYFTALSTDPGFNRLDTNPCKLLDFQLVVLGDGETVSGSTAGREHLAVLLGGKATVTAGDHTFERVGGRPNVFAGKPTSVYIPANTDYTLTGAGRVEIALVSAPSDLKADPYVITPEQVVRGRWGAANFSRDFHQILTQDGQPDLPARRLIVGETFTPSGHWSTYPAHKHEKDEGGEAFHEEMYFFKVTPANGFGIARHYGDGYEDNHTVRDNTILMMPHGYHTYVGAPGFSSYYLWFLAGDHRNQGVSADPDTGWVNNTVAMLRSLGH
ncbi:MAG: 5-deoxy-glucuronate isomerase [Phototrophicaceae bacterium]